MDAGNAAFHDVSRDQLREVLEPEAGGLDLARSELPWLDGLIGLADAAGDDRDRVFQRDVRDWRSQQCAHKVQRFGLFWQLVFEPARTADRQMRAGRVRYHQIPSEMQDVAHVALIVCAWRLAWQQIATERGPALSAKCIAHRSRKLAGDKNAFHRSATSTGFTSAKTT